MNSIEDRVIAIAPEDISWPFEGQPRIGTKPRRGYGRTIIVDPFPAYAHDRSLAVNMLRYVESRFLTGYPPNMYLLPRETPERTNGYCDRDWIYKDGGGTDGYEPWIVLQAKRIPPHPAMTRYLVAHEYGHLVQWWIELKRGIKDASTTQFDEEYMKLRPGSTNRYGGGQWHQNVGELIANDFRILVADIEADFWPHPGFEHPLNLPAVQDFWDAQAEKFAYREEEKAA